VSQLDVLNLTPTHPLNPDYAFAKKRPISHLSAKANHGAPYMRDVTDILHQFVFSWNDKLAADARKLKRYYEQYRKGFFTYIDHEGGGREFVGRFSTPVEPSPLSHNHWSIQQIVFDEIPGLPMRNYPSDWAQDAIWELAVNDFGNRMVAAASGTWVLVADANAKTGFHFENAGIAITDTATYVYLGYGFQFWAPSGPAYGQAQLILDGAVIGTVDFYSAATKPSSALFTLKNVVAGQHVLSLQPLHTKNAASSGYTVLWDALWVMI